MKKFVIITQNADMINLSVGNMILSGGSHEIGAAKINSYNKAKEMWKEDTYGRSRKFASSD